MNTLTNKKVLLGITGSIAAYKSADLVRRLREQGAEVRVVMTAAATEFITPLTLQALSGQRVHSLILDAEAEAAMGHIELARWAEVVLVAPATADFLAKLAYGHANDLLSTLCITTTAPITVAPAMNQQMWQAPVTQENCQRLQERGIKIFGPAMGSQACGEIGAGRMLEPLELVQCLEGLFKKGSLVNHQILITAGPTREDIDPVRFITNRSSGRMGYAIASAAYAAGAQVTLVNGPVSLSPPLGVQISPVYNAQEMLEAVMTHIPTTDIFIAAAAVADYRPVQQATQKLKKKEAVMQLTLERTPDILATVANLPNPPFTVGFAAETNNLIDYARSKLQRKKLDMIAANQVGIEGVGFDSEENALHVFWTEGSVELSRCSKKEIANKLVDLIIQRYQLKKRLSS
ncbi:bifunctional phosphopantothenoylcysteine decarboxylase/phosphopantothenate--cysteine ligase CoaBC [Candidatus Parabeggiatoa sp. HSG14]|uniref:bifunctional phosphopantothenoylcysteine decarboxylase/phosphopantothenate--cysteine ligase CoaBC n=1 Tax=Candidatus Parabeggiatoa sp. HSG14 TaxID=3055593 RepID=UPI0025A9231D|nr:bifunctional phosphopantothenoylcysteine decarboxylase/phosphopantothenate--cysteine ligase CoaBC [Thiotrichales bacterium HSG14]